MKVIIDDIKNILDEIGGDAYIVGGYIRDKLLGKKTHIKDLDITYKGDINSFIKMLKEKGYKIFTLNKEMKIYRAIIRDKILDISYLKGNTIEEDLSLRDFTINAIALKLTDDTIIDPYKGKDDLKNKVLNDVNNSIKNDRIRILRAYRFLLKYEMNFSESCRKHIIEESKYIKQCAKERIFNELMLIIQEDDKGLAFEKMDREKVLENLLPYINELKVIGKCKYHIEDAFTHMNLVYKNFKKLLQGDFKLNGLDLDVFNNYVAGFSMNNYLSFAAFCHDIGKAKCYRRTEDKVSFIGHDKEGSNIMKKVCSDLGFPKKAQKIIATVVEAHMYPLGLCKNNIKNYKKSFYKFFSRYNQYIPYILAISYCDMHATKMLYDPDNEESIFIEFIERLFYEYKIYVKSKDNKFISGKEVIEFTGAKDEEIKKILDEVTRKIYFGDIKTKDQAIEFLKQNYKVSKNINKS